MVICSGTLSPLELWQKILGLDNKTSILQKFGSITDPRRVRVVTFKESPMHKRLTTKYDYRSSNPDIYHDYLSAIEKLVELALPGGILVFVPSYAFMDKLQIPNYIMTSTLEQVKCYIEERDSKENQYVIEDFTASVKRKKGKSVLVGVLGGKFSEGADFPNELSRMVIICGIPYPPIHDPVIKLKRDYYEQQQKGLGQEWYQASAFRKVAQALGRGWRSDTDYSIGILLDERFMYNSVTNKLPLWLTNRLYKSKGWEDGQRVIEDFLVRVENLEKDKKI